MANFWQGSEPTTCDCCNKAIAGSFIDGKTIYGPWAVMDTGCHKKLGMGLGIGKGQQYDRQQDGRWMKVEG